MVMYFWERSASVWIALLYVLMGGLLLAFPAATSTVFVWALAGGAAFYGISHLLRYLQTRKKGTSSPADLFLTVLPLAIMALRAGTPDTAALMLSSIIPLVLGAIIVVNPFQTVQLVVRIFGLGLIADGAADFAAVFTARKAGQS